MKFVSLTPKCVGAIAALVLLLCFESFLFVGMLDWYGWFTGKQALIAIAALTLAIVTAAGLMYRYLPFKIAPLAVANAVLLLLVWQFPVTDTPRFFIAVDRVRIG